jgi:hypothetical protein
MKQPSGGISHLKVCDVVELDVRCTLHASITMSTPTPTPQAVQQFYDVSMYPYRKDSQRKCPYSLEQRVSFILHSCVRKQKTLPALCPLSVDSKHCDNAMERKKDINVFN